jgi:dsRNA-specific ribonuclease
MASSIVVASNYVHNTLGYSFQDTRLLEEALDTTGLRLPGSNGRLAMIGDSRLKDVILDDWYASGASKGN